MKSVHRLRHSSASPKAQRGVALAVALIILVVATLIALSASRFTVLAVRQSTNVETVRSAEQGAQSVVDAVVSLPDIAVLTGNEGDTICTTNLSGCTATIPALRNNQFAAEIAASEVTARVERLAPLLRPLPRPSAGREGSSSSVTLYEGATFLVQGTYDRSGAGLSRAQVDQGILVRVPVGTH